MVCGNAVFSANSWSNFVSAQKDRADIDRDVDHREPWLITAKLNTENSVKPSTQVCHWKTLLGKYKRIHKFRCDLMIYPRHWPPKTLAAQTNGSKISHHRQSAGQLQLKQENISLGSVVFLLLNLSVSCSKLPFNMFPFEDKFAAAAVSGWNVPVPLAWSCASEQNLLGRKKRCKGNCFRVAWGKQNNPEIAALVIWWQFCWQVKPLATLLSEETFASELLKWHFQILLCSWNGWGSRTNQIDRHWIWILTLIFPESTKLCPTSTKTRHSNRPRRRRRLPCTSTRVVGKSKIEVLLLFLGLLRKLLLGVGLQFSAF